MIIKVFFIAVTLISLFGLMGDEHPSKPFSYALVSVVGMVSTLIISLLS